MAIRDSLKFRFENPDIGIRDSLMGVRDSLILGLGIP